MFPTFNIAAIRKKIVFYVEVKKNKKTIETAFMNENQVHVIEI